MAPARGKGRKLKQERAHTTRGEILSAAITFFAQRGIANTTVVQLAKSIGMTPGLPKQARFRSPSASIRSRLERCSSKRKTSTSAMANTTPPTQSG